MRAAIYARRSTDEHQEASLDVQREEALRFASSKGWSVEAEHIFLEVARLREQAESQLGEMRSMIDRNPTEGRKVLESLLSGPILCEPDRDRRVYALRAPLAVPAVLGVALNMTSTAGFEPASPALRRHRAAVPLKLPEVTRQGRPGPRASRERGGDLDVPSAQAASGSQRTIAAARVKPAPCE